MEEPTSVDASGPSHWSPEEFRRHGHAAVDRIARYMQEVATLPVRCPLSPGQVRDALTAAPPGTGESFDTIMAEFDAVIAPGLTHWQSPNFFAYFPANASPPAIVAELLSAGFGVQGMLWTTSPACTELETHVLDWMVELLGLPARFLSSGKGGGVIQDTASSSALCALLAARERSTAGETNRLGVRQTLTAYTSVDAHSSILKAVRIAGIGDANLRLVPTDANHAMDANALARMMDEDAAAGRIPFFACATLGTTSSTAFDPVPAIAAACRRHRAWLHVDAAYAGSAAVCEEHRWMNAGLEDADSYCMNPHKWLLTNFDCDCFWVADREALVGALGVLPEFLRNAATASGEVFDYRDWQIPLGRRFRALKLWFVIRSYGITGLQSHIRAHVAAAQAFRRQVEADPDFEVMAPAPLALVCFRHRSDDAFNERLLERLNAGGRVYLTHTRLDGRYVLRMAVGATTTTADHVAAAWQLIRETARGEAHSR